MENIKKEWEQDCERFVTFLDIKGFKDYVSRNDHQFIKDKLLKIKVLANVIDDVLEKKLGASVKHVTFSDTICL